MFPSWTEKHSLRDWSQAGRRGTHGVERPRAGGTDPRPLPEHPGRGPGDALRRDRGLWRHALHGARAASAGPGLVRRQPGDLRGPDGIVGVAAVDALRGGRLAALGTAAATGLRRRWPALGRRDAVAGRPRP